ncbi:MAG: hypothetical protein HYV95_02050 [Opitutae bacterium]|nr:hypothetical protein [Opitutae bacterium]
MPAILILTTNDAQLAAAWSGQLPYPDFAAPNPESLRRELAQGGARVWVRDLADPRSKLVAHADTVIIAVGQPQSLPFEQAKLTGNARFFLSYNDSLTQLKETIRTAAEIAEKNAIINTLQARGGRAASTVAPVRENTPLPYPVDDLNFIEAAIEHLEDRGRVLEEFRRAAQTLLRSSRANLFLRGPDGFLADRNGWTSPTDSPLSQRMEDYPSVIDLDDWAGTADAATESYIRQQMQSWGARLLVPLYDSGRLAGWAAYGPRADGRSYDGHDRNRALQLGRLLERCLEKADRLRVLARSAEIENLRGKYLAGARILDPGAPSDASLPPEIRALAGEVLRTGQVARLEPSPIMRFRAKAGPVPETGGVWVHWEDASLELMERSTVAEGDRLKICREMGLSLSHELGGPLVTISTFLQLCQQQGASPELVAEFIPQLARESDKLNRLSRMLHLMQEFMGGNATRIDLGEMARSLQLKGSIRIEPNEMAPVIHGNESMVRFALQTIVDAVARNRGDNDSLLTISVKRRGEGENETGLFVIAGRNLLLEGFIETAKDTVPVHPLLGVFLAREIIHLHNGTLQGGQGIAGSEVQISLRSRAPTRPPFGSFAGSGRSPVTTADRSRSGVSS